MESIKKTFLAGETIYSEGKRVNYLYLIAKGEVEISALRGGHKAILAQLGAGDAFGESLSLVEPDVVATTSAMASTLCEVQMVDARVLDSLLQGTPSQLRGLFESLARRLHQLHEIATQHAHPESPVLVYAHILDLIYRATPQPPDRGAARTGLAKVRYQDFLKKVNVIAGHPPVLVRRLLKLMTRTSLIGTEGSGENLLITFNSDNLINLARGFSKNLSPAAMAHIQAESEFMEVTEMAQMIGVDRQRIIQKLAQGEYADDLITFRKSIVTKILAKHGRAYFEKRKIKKVEDFSELSDFEFVDRDTLFRSLGKLDTMQIAKLLFSSGEENVCQRIKAAMPKRKQEQVEEDLAQISRVDDVEVAELVDKVITEIKTIKLGAQANPPKVENK